MPWKVSALVSAFRVAFWEASYREQSNQNLFTSIAKDQGLVRPGEVRDNHSGGARTFSALLEALGLIFRDGDAVKFTLAGEAMMDPDIEPAGIVRHLLLGFQYPCVYSEGTGVRMDQSVKIKPFLFLLRLMDDPDVKSLSDREVMIPVIFAKTSRDFDICKNLILRMRGGESIESFIVDPSMLWTSRSKGSVSLRLKDVADIANTMRNCISSVGLCYRDDSDPSQARFFLSPEFRSQVGEALAISELFLEVQSEESFQRSFGTVNRQKDTRNLNKAPKRDAEAEKVLALWLAECGQRMMSAIPEDFVERLERGYGIPRAKTIRVVEPYVPQALSRFESTLLEKACGGVATAKEFEKLVNELIRVVLQLEVLDTGNKKRPPGKSGGYSDGIILNLAQSSCALVECKASSAYSFPFTDRLNAMENYIPNFRELCTRELTLAFFLYVAGGFVPTAKAHVESMSQQAGTSVAAVDVRTLLKIAALNSPSDAWQLFCKGSLLV